MVFIFTTVQHIGSYVLFQLYNEIPHSNNIFTHKNNVYEIFSCTPVVGLEPLSTLNCNFGHVKPEAVMKQDICCLSAVQAQMWQCDLTLICVGCLDKLAILENSGSSEGTSPAQPETEAWRKEVKSGKHTVVNNKKQITAIFLVLNYIF